MKFTAVLIAALFLSLEGITEVCTDPFDELNALDFYLNEVVDCDGSAPVDFYLAKDKSNDAPGFGTLKPKCGTENQELILYQSDFVNSKQTSGTHVAFVSTHLSGTGWGEMGIERGCGRPKEVAILDTNGATIDVDKKSVYAVISVFRSAKKDELAAYVSDTEFRSTRIVWRDKDGSKIATATKMLIPKKASAKCAQGSWHIKARSQSIDPAVLAYSVAIKENEDFFCRELPHMWSKGELTVSDYVMFGCVSMMTTAAFIGMSIALILRLKREGFVGGYMRLGSNDIELDSMENWNGGH